MHARVLAAAGLFALVPAAVSAQACLGLPSSDGQIAVAGFGAFVDSDFEPGGEFHVDVTGPASFRFEYNHGHEEVVATPGGPGTYDFGRSYAGLAAYELFLLDPSICAVGGVSYTTHPLLAPDDDQFGVTLGFGIGKTLEGRGFSATVYAVPQYVRLLETAGQADGTSNEFMAETGVTVGLLPFFVGGAVTLTTIGDAEPGLRIRAGLIF